VRIKVEDRIPPKIVYPAQDKTVECDGLGNTEEFPSGWKATEEPGLSITAAIFSGSTTIEVMEAADLTRGGGRVA